MFADTVMADLEVDSMSDAELRTSLAEHGFPVMPITASTRKTLAKKLKHVLSEQGKSRNSVDSKGDARPSFARPSGKTVVHASMLSSMYNVPRVQFDQISLTLSPKYLQHGLLENHCVVEVTHLNVQSMRLPLALKYGFKLQVKKKKNCI